MHSENYYRYALVLRKLCISCFVRVDPFANNFDNGLHDMRAKHLHATHSGYESVGAQSTSTSELLFEALSGLASIG